MKVPVHGAVLDGAERDALIAVANAGWYTHGKYCVSFERRLRDYIGVRSASLCNSGSSANLLALSALTSPELGERRIMPGDEVITTAVNFPTTVNPIIQVGAVPVLIDMAPGLVPDLTQLERAFSPRTKAVIFAHTLGFPFRSEYVRQFCNNAQLWMISDCCDSLGTEEVGTYGDLSTFSFFPAHHITMGEGGAVCTNSLELTKLVRSFRDWGRACWCEPGQDNTCGHRFDGDYDHKYSYSHIGYNLKATETQAAIGLAQFGKLDEFNKVRRLNFKYLLSRWTSQLDIYLSPIYRDLPDGVSPFGFPVLCYGDYRNDLMKYLDLRGVGNRPVFAGNILRQPAYKDIVRRVVGSLEQSNIIHERALWVGCWPGLSFDQLDYTIETIKEFFK